LACWHGWYFPVDPDEDIARLAEVSLPGPRGRSKF
jgi:hypothetical protein